MIIKPIKVENAGFDREVSYKEYAVNIRDKNTDKFINQYDCYETYDEALQSAKTIDLKDDEIYEIVEIEYDENGDELGINTITDSTLEECNSLKENYSLVGIYTDEHGMEKKDYIKDFDNKGDIDKYMADNEDELKAKNYDKIITESKKDDRFQANLSLHSKFGIDKGSKLIQELDTALEQSDKQKIKKLANKIKKELSPNDYNSFVKTYYPEYIDVLEEKEIKVTENSHKVNMIYTPIVEHKVITNRARKLKESLSQNEEDAIYSAGDFGELLDTLDNMKQDAKVQRARNLTSHAYTHIPDEEEDERLDEIKDEVISILTESYKDGWKPELDLYKRDIEAIANSLGISPNEVQKEADAIKFRYNGKVYFAEPVSMYQVDVFDDNHNQIGYGVNVEKIKGEVFTEFTDNDYLYELVGGEYAGTYTRAEAEKLPIKEPDLTPDESEIRNNGGFTHRKELDNQFQFKGYLGPMWNGIQDGKPVIRYETQQVYNQLSK